MTTTLLCTLIITTVKIYDDNKILSQKTNTLEEKIKTVESQNVVLQDNMLYLEEQLEEKVEISRSNSDLTNEIETIVNENAVITTIEEVELFEKVIEAEFRDCSYEAKLMGATVVMNRVIAWEQSITKILLQEGQFSVVSNGSIYKVTVSDSTKQAVKDALSGKRSFNENVLYFWADWLPTNHPLWNRKIECSFEGTIFAY